MTPKKFDFVPVKPKALITPSPFQQKIYDFVQYGKGSAVVIAVAGSGKTTTIVEAASLIPPTATAAFVAFNKAIATELATRLPSRVRSQTLNAMGFGAWARSSSRKLTVDSFKTRKIVDEVVPITDLRLYGQILPRLIGLAKSVGLVPNGANGTSLTEDTEFNWMELIEFYELMNGEGDRAKLIEYARKVLAESIKVSDRLIDFDDQLYMPVIAGASFYQHDFLFVDEAQDVNMIQRAMLRKALKSNGRLIAVGDRNQAIYGFRGADHNAIDNIKADFSAVELPLSISYRCPTSVVAHAQQYVSHILPHSAAPAGLVETPKHWAAADFKANDVVVCRCTAPVVSLAYKLIRAKVPCFVMGREIGQGLIGVIDKMKAAGIDDLSTKLEAYRTRETNRLLGLKQDSKAEALGDRLDTIELFIDELSEDARTIDALKNSISSLFSDNMAAQAVKLMTIHKSKGLEADRVFILNFALNERFMAKPGNQQQQEINLAYVAITRAKKELRYVTLTMFDKKKSGK